MTLLPPPKPAEPLVTKDDASRLSRVDVALADKPLLKLAQASLLTGLSRHILREAIDSGRLKAKMLGRAYSIKRVDLDAFIKRL